MSITSLLVSAIDQTFMEKVGKFKADKYAKMTIALPASLNEEGYRNLEIVIYAPMNYVQVWVRETADVISHEDMEYNEADDEMYIKAGKDYTKSATPWEKVADHDSAWRSGLEDIFRTRSGYLLCFSGPDPWLRVVEEAFSPEAV
jgi:hypothetical protein